MPKLTTTARMYLSICRRLAALLSGANTQPRRESTPKRSSAILSPRQMVKKDSTMHRDSTTIHRPLPASLCSGVCWSLPLIPLFFVLAAAAAVAVIPPAAPPAESGEKGRG